jgi:HAD superfamily hydrolase (TIGR01509 family)
LARFIYFDLGNVLVHFDPNRACRNVAERTGAAEADVFAALYGSGIELRYERGELDDEQFAAAFRRELGRPIATADLLAGMADMFTPREEMVPLIGVLRSLVEAQRLAGLGILSNTCAAHWQWVLRQGWAVVGGWHRQAVLSYQVGYLKPEPEIYQLAARRVDLPPDQLFFTDDREENVRAAEQCGWRAELFVGVETLRAALLDWGLPLPD